MEACESIFNSLKKHVEFNQPIPPFHERPPHILEGIIGSTKLTFGNKYLNPTVLDAAAAYLNHLTRGHPFKKGNKRMAIIFTLTFLKVDGIELKPTFRQLYEFSLLIAVASQHRVSAEKTKEACRNMIKDFATNSKQRTK